VEATKLLQIHKRVGFSFVEGDNEIIRQLATQEGCDREKKMEWEKRNCDQ
jgi:hypothetical protein